MLSRRHSSLTGFVCVRMSTASFFSFTLTLPCSTMRLLSHQRTERAPGLFCLGSAGFFFAGPFCRSKGALLKENSSPVLATRWK